MLVSLVILGGLFASWDDHPHCVCNDAEIRRARWILGSVIVPFVAVPGIAVHLQIGRSLRARRRRLAEAHVIRP